MVAGDPAAAWAEIRKRAARDGARAPAESARIEKGEIGAINYDAGGSSGSSSGARAASGDTAGARARDAIQRADGGLSAPQYQRRTARLAELREEPDAQPWWWRADGGKEKDTAARPDRSTSTSPSQMGLHRQERPTTSRALWEFVSGEPREANTEGGVFPAIFGTVLMVILMSIVVTPLGVLAAFYLREYAKQGAFVCDGAHRGQQPGRCAFHRLRGLRRRLLHLRRRRDHRPALLRRGAAHADLRHRAASSGPR